MKIERFNVALTSSDKFIELQPDPEGSLCFASEVVKLEAKCAELETKCAEMLEACEAALSMFDKMTDSKGPYKYIDGTGLVSDAYDISRLLKQAIAKAKGEQP